MMRASMDFLEQLTLGSKLRYGIGALLGIIFLLSAASIYSSRQQTTQLRSMYTLTLLGLSATQETHTHLMEVGRDLRQLLLEAQRPLVMAGGGGWTPQAAQALQRFAENWQLPVANAFRFQDTFDNHHPLYAGDVGLGINPKLAARIREADLLLVLGARLGEATTGSYTLIDAPLPKQKLVHIHASAEELGRVYHPTLAICATMNAAARSLEVLTAPPQVAWEPWAAAAQADYRANIDPANGGVVLPGLVDMPEVMDVVRRLLPADAVLTNGAGNFASWLHRFNPYHRLDKGHSRRGRSVTRHERSLYRS